MTDQYENNDDVENTTDEQHEEQQEEHIQLSKMEYEKMKAALAKANKEAQRKRQELKQWEETGIDPQSAKALLEKQKEAEMRSAEERGDFDKIRKQMLQQHEAKLREKDELVGKMKSTLESYLVDNAAIATISEFDGVPQLLLPHIKQKVKVVEEGGKYQVQVVDEDGSPRINANGDYLSIKELVSEMRSDPVFGMAFKAPKVSGNGTSTDATGKPRKNSAQTLNKPKAQWTEKERTEYISKNGFAAYKAHK